MKRTTTATSRIRSSVARTLRRTARRLEARDAPFDRLLWLLGAPRTGSTWLSMMLAAHPRVRAHNEPLVGAHLGARSSSTLEAVLGSYDDTLWNLGRERHEYIFAHGRRDVWAPILGDLMRARLLPRTRHQFTVVKEPHGSEAAPHLLGLTPGSRLLFLVRDPRDCIDSVLDIVQHGWTSHGNGTGHLAAPDRRHLVEQAAEYWTWRIDAVQTAFDQLSEDKRLLVRYEDLRVEPEQGLAQILAWLRLPVSPEWTATIARTYAFEKVPQEQRGPGHFHRQARPGGWRDALTGEEQALLGEMLRPHLARYGYPPT